MNEDGVPPAEAAPPDVQRAASPRGPFMLEAMVSAGPRKLRDEYEKDSQSRDFCEDCAGYAAVAEKIIFWVCDGTSDSTMLPPLAGLPHCSSRALAQDVARHFAPAMALALHRGESAEMVELGTRVFKQISSAWRDRLGVYFAAVRDAGALPQLLESLPAAIDGSHVMKWSTTFLGGVFDEATRTLDLVNFGDCRAIVAGRPPVVVAPNSQRVILRVALFPDLSPQTDMIVTINQVSGWRRYADVDGFVAISDGLLTEQHYRALLEGLPRELDDLAIGAIRDDLALRTDHTDDDRTLLVGRFLPVPDEG